MQKPQTPANEMQRIRALQSYSLLDTLPERDYDDLTSLAAEICNTPIALISLIDTHRQWFKSRYGLDATETPREYAFCAHAINKQDEIMIVTDSREDTRFSDNPLVTDQPHVIFYVGVPLNDSDNFPLGTLCVIDHEPRQLNEQQQKALKALSNQIINLFELRRKNALLNSTILELEQRSENLERFANVATHELKTPLIGISGLARLLSDQFGSQLGDAGKVMLKMIEEGASDLTNMINGLMEYSRCEALLRAHKFTIRTADEINEIKGMFTHVDKLNISLETELEKLTVNKSVLDRSLINLVSNSIRFNRSPSIEIRIRISETDTHYLFEVEDNGIGIAKDKQDSIFTIFEEGIQKDRFGKKSMGIGLATIKKIIEKSGGEITVSSELNKGSIFSFSLTK